VGDGLLELRLGRSGYVGHCGWGEEERGVLSDAVDDHLVCLRKFYVRIAEGFAFTNLPVVFEI
jgi:hypothetical protein